jgi:hypothetical protein
MLIIGSILLLLANAVTLRRDKSILFNRVAILILLYSGILANDSLHVVNLDTGIGVFSGLFHSTISFYIFIYDMESRLNFHSPIKKGTDTFLYYMKNKLNLHRPQGYLFKVSSAHGRSLSNSRPQLAGLTSSLCFTLPTPCFCLFFFLS